MRKNGTNVWRDRKNIGDIKLMEVDNVWIYTVVKCYGADKNYAVKDLCKGVVIADNREEARKKVTEAYIDHYVSYDPIHDIVRIENAAQKACIFEDHPDVVEVAF